MCDAVDKEIDNVIDICNKRIELIMCTENWLRKELISALDRNKELEKKLSDSIEMETVRIKGRVKHIAETNKVMEKMINDISSLRDDNTYLREQLSEARRDVRLLKDLLEEGKRDGINS